MALLPSQFGIIFVAFVNFLFVASGIVMAGMAMYVKSVTVEELVARALSYEEDSWRSATFSETNDALSQTMDIFIAIGVILSIVGIVGCCGALIPARKILLFYLVLSAIMFIFLFTMLIFILIKKPQSVAKAAFKHIIRKTYAGFNSTAVHTVFVNHVMKKHKCCGLDGYEEFDAAENWKKTVFTQRIPESCCHDVKVNVVNCTISPTTANAYLNTGCREAISESVSKFTAPLLTLGTVILLFEMMSFGAAVFVILSIPNDNMSESDESEQNIEAGNNAMSADEEDEKKERKKTGRLRRGKRDKKAEKQDNQQENVNVSDMLYNILSWFTVGEEPVVEQEPPKRKRKQKQPKPPPQVVSEKKNLEEGEEDCD